VAPYYLSWKAREYDFTTRFEIRPNAFYNGHRALESVPLDDELLAAQDCVAVLVRHRCVDYGRVVRVAPLVMDAVNATRGMGNPDGRVVRLGAGEQSGMVEMAQG
jgi:UDP-N-acetyl-D-mannosaminuronate dehydrogenase